MLDGLAPLAPLKRANVARHARPALFAPLREGDPRPPATVALPPGRAAVPGEASRDAGDRLHDPHEPRRSGQPRARPSARRSMSRSMSRAVPRDTPRQRRTRGERAPPGRGAVGLAASTAARAPPARRPHGPPRTARAFPCQGAACRLRAGQPDLGLHVRRPLRCRGAGRLGRGKGGLGGPAVLRRRGRTGRRAGSRASCGSPRRWVGSRSAGSASVRACSGRRRRARWSSSSSTRPLPPATAASSGNATP
jgi:hypothetical protein